MAKASFDSAKASPSPALASASSSSTDGTSRSDASGQARRAARMVVVLAMATMCLPGALISSMRCTVEPAGTKYVLSIIV